MIKTQLAKDIRAKFAEWLHHAKQGVFTPSEVEDYNNPMCMAYSQGPDFSRACVECPLEGKICEAIQSAYNAAYDDRDPLPALTEASELLEDSLASWVDSVPLDVPA